MNPADLEGTSSEYMSRLYGETCCVGEEAIRERKRKDQERKARQRASRSNGVSLGDDVVAFLKSDCEYTVGEGTERIIVHEGVRYNTTGLMERVLCDRFGLPYNRTTLRALRRAFVYEVGHRIKDRFERGPVRNPGEGRPMPKPKAEPAGE